MSRYVKVKRTESPPSLEGPPPPPEGMFPVVALTLDLGRAPEASLEWWLRQLTDTMRLRGYCLKLSFTRPGTPPIGDHVVHWPAAPDLDATTPG